MDSDNIVAGKECEKQMKWHDAISWYQRASGSSFEKANESLLNLYLVAAKHYESLKNWKDAIEWYHKAIKSGSEKAKDLLLDL